jgi:arabinofuranan 3-O-arabinosyltransferase
MPAAEASGNGILPAVASAGHHPVMISLPPACRAWFSRAFRFLQKEGVRRTFVWIALFVCTSIAVGWAWNCYDVRNRRDHNYGHATIDFGGQWVMGRMLVTGNGRQLYDRLVLRRILEEAYPRADSEEPRLHVTVAGGLAPLAAGDCVGAAVLLAGVPDADVGDPQRLLDWMIGEDSPEDAAQIGSCLTPLGASEPVGATALTVTENASWQPLVPRIGGPLYPPVNSYLFSPLGLLKPRPAYRTMQAFNLALTFAIAFLTQRITGGRVWWQVAAMLLMAFPGYSGALNLGQNALLSLFLLMFGWRQLQLSRTGVAGMAWGLLVFKPVWVAAFILVPLLTRRWRMAATMATTATVVCAATLPAVGWQSWEHWLSIGSRASELYATCEPWIFLSRDLIGVPRRYLLTFKDGYSIVDDPRAKLATTLGLALWLIPLAVTVAAVISRGRRTARVTSGPQASFVLFGAWLACYHFMYYDTMLAFLPCCLLYAEPRRVVRRIVHGMPPGTWRGLIRSAVVTVLFICLSAFPYFSTQIDPSYHFPPWDTLCVALLWLWCDLAHGQGSAHAPQLGEYGRGIVGTHEGLADEDGTHTRPEQSFNICTSADAALANQADSRRDGRGDIQRVPESGDEGS